MSTARSIVVAFAGVASAECAHITAGCTAGRGYEWALRDTRADTRVLGRAEPTRSNTDPHWNP